ncbi:uncharacterized protein MONBRDRAFT_24449 [Monosiga brevicollis MX1]|uniref:C2H2-type domain-containing protein n=1 Tax=Monosiga brevicollis TaxID=81824 RepID=A9UWG1_MONBE|nr:uncharacterized protein MONBRDRAFT_24449 [Monosiga brevicollis MX1]EDQ90559.1 predicted protein [Monosiga brevicollis MX1]|eukprot:XP_001744610.1 hypothetical protein [Monosiga brevicollis MX1]
MSVAPNKTVVAEANKQLQAMPRTQLGCFIDAQGREPLIVCPKCSLTFKNQKDRENHHRKHHQQESWITIGQRTFLLKRALDDRFFCPFINCKKNYAWGEGIRRHLKTKHGPVIKDPAAKLNVRSSAIVTSGRKRTSKKGTLGADVVFRTRPAPEQELQALTVNGVQMNVGDLGKGLRALRAEMDDTLTTELLFNSGLEKRVYAVLPLLRDSHQPEPPQSWVGQDLKDIDGNDFYTMLLKHILETPKLVKEFTSPNAPGKFSVEPVWRWICSLREFNRLALTYAHLSTGLSVRAVVYSSLFYRDSPASPRSVFFSGDRLAVVARRGKTTRISNREWHATHYMDKRASAVMMAYLLLCKPLEELFIDYLQERGELITSSTIDPIPLTEQEQDELEADAMEAEDSIEPDNVGSVDDQHDNLLRAAKRVELEGTSKNSFTQAKSIKLFRP